MAVLPNDGQTSLEQLARVLRQASNILGIAPEASVLSAIVRNPDGLAWSNFATVLHAGRPFGGELVDHSLGSLRLIGFGATVATDRDLREFLGLWTKSVGAGLPLDFQEVAHSRRYPSRSAWSQIPCWKIDLHERKGRERFRLPQGPFFNPRERMFFETVGAAAAEWVHDPTLKGNTSLENCYRVIVPDQRAYFSKLKADGNDLEITVSSFVKRELHCAINARDFDGNVEGQLLRVDEGKVQATFSRSVRALDLFLLGSESALYDEYHESETHTSWGKSLYNQDRVGARPSHVNLLQALEQGEGEGVEFKEWIEVNPRDRKSLELLETAVAFANASGGSIYVGVNKHLEIVGVQRNLGRSYGRTSRGDFVKERDAYVNDLRRVLSEGVSPSIAATFEWVDHAGNWVVRVTVPSGEEKPYEVVETGDRFIRRGGSNRKVTRLELEQMFRR